MNKDTLWNAMEHLSPDLIEEADRPQRQRMSPGKILVIAAAVCLVLAVGVLAAESIFGFRVIEMYNDGENNSYELIAEETVKFPVSQFGETVQDYIANGMPVKEGEVQEEPVTPGGEVEAAVIALDVPTFSTWEEAADFIGREIPLAAENPVLAAGTRRDITVRVNANVVSLNTVYELEGHSILFSASMEVEGTDGFSVGAYLGKGDLTITPQQSVTGSGEDVLLYVTEGERPTCDAYFIQDGILYNIFLSSGDIALMEEILAAF